MSWFCKHDWKVLDKTETKSPIETLCSMGDFKFDEGPASLLRKVYSTIVHCPKCGAIKRFVTEMP